MLRRFCVWYLDYCNNLDEKRYDKKLKKDLLEFALKHNLYLHYYKLEDGYEGGYNYYVVIHNSKFKSLKEIDEDDEFWKDIPSDYFILYYFKDEVKVKYKFKGIEPEVIGKDRKKKIDLILQ